MTTFPHVRLEYIGPGDSGRTRWLVIEEMHVAHPLLPVDYATGALWETDLASVPRMLLVWLLVGGDAPASGVVHDWLYRTGFLTRRYADQIFYDLIIREGYSAFKAWLMWSGVRAGGWVTWRKYRKGENK